MEPAANTSASPVSLAVRSSTTPKSNSAWRSTSMLLGDIISTTKSPNGAFSVHDATCRTYDPSGCSSMYAHSKSSIVMVPSVVRVSSL